MGEESDPYVMWEEDPAESHAIESSLWEIQSLRSHFCPNVSILAKTFVSTDMFSKKVQPLPLADFYSIKYQELFHDALKPRGTAKRRREPAAVAHVNPGALFGQSKEGKEAARLADLEDRRKRVRKKGPWAATQQSGDLDEMQPMSPLFQDKSVF